jgi:hypothetical protein
MGMRGLDGIRRRSGHIVLVLLARLMLMSCFPILDLGLERLRRNSGRMLEHELATEHSGPYETRDPDDAHLLLATLVGAIVLARAVDDRALSNEILERVARALQRDVDQGPEI